MDKEDAEEIVLRLLSYLENEEIKAILLKVIEEFEVPYSLEEREA